jgi:hypothetical protein
MTAPFQIRRKRNKAYRKQTVAPLFRNRRRMTGLTGWAPTAVTMVFGYDKRLRRWLNLLSGYHFLLVFF